MFKKKRMHTLRTQSAARQPTVWVGKDGVTDRVLDQIGRQLEANEMIKIKVHKPSLKDTEVREIASRIADKTCSEIVDVRGRTFTVYRQRKKREVRGSRLVA